MKRYCRDSNKGIERLQEIYKNILQQLHYVGQYLDKKINDTQNMSREGLLESINVFEQKLFKLK